MILDQIAALPRGECRIRIVRELHTADRCSDDSPLFRLSSTAIDSRSDSDARIALNCAPGNGGARQRRETPILR